MCMLRLPYNDVEIFEVEANGLCLSCAAKPSNPDVVWYDGNLPGSNPMNLSHAINKALILKGVIELMQANYNAPCGFLSTTTAMTQLIVVCIVLVVELMMMRRILTMYRSRSLHQHQQEFVSGLSTQVANKIWSTQSVQLHF